MLSDELESKPELLVQFVQNTSIPLGQGLVESETKDITCLSLLPVTEASECNRLLLPGLGSSAEHLVFVQDEAEDSGNDFLSGESTDSSIPWFLRVQELAHDSLIAATRAQLAKNAKTNNGETVHLGSGDGQPKDSGPLPQVEKKLKCTVEGCDRTFVWPAHFKYHLKTHRNDRSFICPAEGCGKSFYVLQRLKVHMRTHNGEKPFMCPEPGCGKQFTTAGNLKNHFRIHTGEKPFLCEAQGCGRSFAEYSSLRKHLVVHSGEKPHQCQVCGKTFSQSGSRNVHMRKHHLQMGTPGRQEREQTAEPLMGSSLLEEASVHSKNLVSMNSQPSLGGESLNLPNTSSILGVDDEVLAEGPPRPLSSVPQVTHHLVTMQSGRQSYEVSVLTAVNPQELLNQGDLTERRT
ncbi:PREDICTED: zinc finger protein 410 isoform X3 [Elephantulus edwardii]|uniref:zinc finger protein 410 isoform X3 n=1 Tax=Elephantulus edwardii TaxID=28737 RepID=UPI0003F06593|nr:PREDICTED: zinc finger protein 410 isoform X3 [Elephantulus edwardii]